ncbi:copper amine oxidase N-terminal domain-containing protein [Anaerotignum sp. MB30-C6]|uniref:copper amine oxidase N-terminal domain-containing protein n=1 Tax=Anaerotignum sp. MB30-C6 TaxID=3070814 RepID=UPI0027DD802B|nr:copper amine oxidase N-terminal domain-containing protein [Anaerotignum sp. MB30-C6]WMI80836.1 copper amine oxidase N-terminal domain-containing protein [Anaerotignum sp. MB30-C6]
MKRYMNKAMAMGMAFAMVGSTVAFAQAKETKNAENLLIATETNDESDTTEKEAAYISQNGKIVSVSKTEDGSYEVLIDNESGGLRFMVSASTVVVDRESGDYLTADQLTEGMEVSVIYGVNSPMGMSMPPFLGQVTAVVANADKGNFVVGSFDENLLSEKDKLVLNISEDTEIQSSLGTKKVFKADDIKGKDALVFFDITTRSIPAQTNPSFVLILEEKPVVEDETEGETAELVPLRDTAEGKGYDVKWQGKAKPVLVENEDVSMEITIGTTKYVIGDKEMVADAAAMLVDGILYVSSDVLV